MSHIFKLGNALVFAVGAVFSCAVIIKQIRQSVLLGALARSDWMAYRALSPKTFWFGMCLLSVLAIAIASAACFLFANAIFPV